MVGGEWFALGNLPVLRGQKFIVISVKLVEGIGVLGLLLPVVDESWKLGGVFKNGAVSESLIYNWGIFDDFSWLNT